MKLFFNNWHTCHVPFKLILILFILITLLSFTVPNTLTDDKLKGNVKIMTLTVYDLFWYPEFRIKFQRKESTEYNKKGNWIVSKKYYEPDIFQDSTIANYDRKENLINVKHYSRYIKKDSFLLLSKLINKYDDLGLKIESNDIEIMTNRSYKAVYKYNYNGKLLETKIYNTDGILKNIQANEDDSTYIKYDLNGKIIERVNISNQGFKHIFKYDTTSFLVEYGTYYPDGSIDNKHIIGSDKYKNIYYDTAFTNKGVGDIRIDKYTYDKIGNWTIDSTFTNDTLTAISKREFEYY